MKRAGYNFLNKIIDIIYPQECLFCGKDGKVLCDDCLELIDFQPKNTCPFCKKYSFLGFTCRQCLSIKNLDGVFNFSFYKNIFLKTLIHGFKYQNVFILKDVLSFQLAIVLENIKKAQKMKKIPRVLNSKTYFFYVPLHKLKERFRGFNQSKLLLNTLLKNKIVSEKQIKYSSKLIRSRFTFSQTKLSQKEKEKNIKKAFSYKGKNLKNKTIILIDDVSTSGSTLEECAKILKENGAKKVYGLVLAR